MAIDFSFTAVTAGVSALAFIFGLYQYRLARITDRAKFAADLTQKLYQDEDLYAAWQFIDIRSADLILPKRYYLDDSKKFYFPHSFAAMQVAFSMNIRRDYGNYVDLATEFRTREIRVYIESFDRLFTFVESMYEYYKSGAIDARRAPHLLFLVQRVSRAYHNNEKIFEDYLQVYDSWRVIYMMELADRYYDVQQTYIVDVLFRPFIERSIRRAVARRLKVGQPAARSKLQKGEE